MLCISAVNAIMRCLSVRLSVTVTFVHSVETNKHIFNFFSPSGNHTILAFPYQALWQYSNGEPPQGQKLWFSNFEQYLALRSMTARASSNGYHTQWWRLCITQTDDAVPASVNLVYDSKPRHCYQSTGIDRRKQTEFNCTHWWIWSRSN